MVKGCPFMTGFFSHLKTSQKSNEVYVPFCQIVIFFDCYWCTGGGSFSKVCPLQPSYYPCTPPAPLPLLLYTVSVAAELLWEEIPQRLEASFVNIGRRSEWQQACRNSNRCHVKSRPVKEAKRQANVSCGFAHENKGNENHMDGMSHQNHTVTKANKPRWQKYSLIPQKNRISIPFMVKGT